jgi:hypothetical protein
MPLELAPLELVPLELAPGALRFVTRRLTVRPVIQVVSPSPIEHIFVE